jgi:hypothetical protein
MGDIQDRSYFDDYIEINNVKNQYSIDFDKAVDGILKAKTFDEVMKLSVVHKLSAYLYKDSYHNSKKYYKKYPKHVIQHVLNLIGCVNDVETVVAQNMYEEMTFIGVSNLDGVKKYTIKHIKLDFTATKFSFSTYETRVVSGWDIKSMEDKIDLPKQVKIDLDEEMIAVKKAIEIETEIFKNSKFISIQTLEDELEKHDWRVARYILIQNNEPFFLLLKYISNSVVKSIEITITPELIANDFIFWVDESDVDLPPVDMCGVRGRIVNIEQSLGEQDYTISHFKTSL